MSQKKRQKAQRKIPYKFQFNNYRKGNFVLKKEKKKKKGILNFNIGRKKERKKNKNKTNRPNKIWTT